MFKKPYIYAIAILIINTSAKTIQRPLWLQTIMSVALFVAGVSCLIYAFRKEVD